MRLVAVRHYSAMSESVIVVAMAGLLAGLGVAMPLGPIGVLILRESITGGFRSGAAAAVGVALVDLTYCAAAVVVGAALAPVLRGWGDWPAVVSGAVLIALGLIQLRRADRPVPTNSAELPRQWITVRFFALTAINPATLLYFFALASAVTLHAANPVTPVVFVVAAGLASLAWQLSLAAVGAGIGAAVSPTFTRRLAWVASVLVVALGIGVLASALLLP